jgi:hypothetical protein
MIVIRDEQAAALAAGAFGRWMKTHLEEFFPQHCAALGDEGTAALIVRGVAKAHGYGLSGEAEMCQLIDLMVCLGEDLDTDPAMPWAGAILGEPEGASPTPKITRLFEAAMAYLDESAYG